MLIPENAAWLATSSTIPCVENSARRVDPYFAGLPWQRAGENLAFTWPSGTQGSPAGRPYA